MISIIKRVWTVLRTEGIRSLWFKLLGETIYRRVDVAIKELHASLPRPVVPQGMEIGLLQGTEIDEYVAFAEFIDHPTVAQRLTEGQLCVTVRKDQELIHCTWITGGQVRIDYQDCHIQLSDGVAYLYESFTSPAWRRQGVSAMRSPALNHFCLEHGYQRRVSVYWPENKAARNSSAKAGNVVIGRLGYIGAGPFKKHFLHFHSDNPPFRLVKSNPKPLA